MVLSSIRGWALSAVCQLLYETEPFDMSGSSNGSEKDCLVSSRCQTPWQSSNTQLLGKFTVWQALAGITC
jgi:hypothetical protein